MAAKSYAHEGKCGPCYLCKKESSKYTHLEKMDPAVVTLIYDMEQLSISICHACYKQASRNVGKPKPKQPPAKAICSIQRCDGNVYRNTSIASREQIEH